MNGYEIEHAMKLLADYWPEARLGEGEIRAWRKVFGLMSATGDEVEAALLRHWRESKRYKPVPADVTAIVAEMRRSRAKERTAREEPESDLTPEQRREWWRRLKATVGGAIEASKS